MLGRADLRRFIFLHTGQPAAGTCLPAGPH